MLEKAKLRSQIKAAGKRNKKASMKVAQRVETKSIPLMVLTNFLKMFVLLFFGALVIFPFYYMISGSLMSYNEINHMGDQALGNTPILLPGDAQWGNYDQAFAEGYWQSFAFSTAVMIIQILFKITVCILLGYAFGRYEFRGKKHLWRFFMLTLMIPEVAIMSGQYWTSVNIVGLNNLFGLMICIGGPFIASIFTAYLFRNGFESIDESVKEAAYIDGISGVRFFFYIAIPMIAPIIWTQVILTAIASWNSYMWPSLLLATNDVKTIPLWLFDIGTSDLETGVARTLMQVRLAGSTLAVLPTLIFYLSFRKRINMTVSGSANKG